MSDFKQYIQYRALAFKFGREIEISEGMEAALEQAVPLRNVCAKLTVELAERIDNTAAVLGITKRSFIERALIEAMDQVDAMLDDVGAWEGLEGEAAK